MSEDTKLLEMIPVNITSYTGIITEEMINNLNEVWKEEWRQFIEQRDMKHSITLNQDDEFQGGDDD